MGEIGGFSKLIFADTPHEDLVDYIFCGEVFKDPWQCRNGHVICRSCIDEAVRNQCIRCPSCRMEFTTFTPCVTVKNIIGKLAVKCARLTDGCQWVGNLNELDSHYSTLCEYIQKPCCNNGCKEILLSKDFQYHVSNLCLFRTMTCCYCLSTMSGFDFQSHLLVCTSLPSKCPNNCDPDLLIPSDLLEEHLNYICPMQKLVCPLKNIGCSATCDGYVYRKDFNNHVNNVESLLSKIEVLLKEIQALKNSKINDSTTINLLKNELHSLKENFNSSHNNIGNNYNDVNNNQNNANKLYIQELEFKLFKSQYLNVLISNLNIETIEFEYFKSNFENNNNNDNNNNNNTSQIKINSNNVTASIKLGFLSTELDILKNWLQICNKLKNFDTFQLICNEIFNINEQQQNIKKNKKFSSLFKNNKHQKLQENFDNEISNNNDDNLSLNCINNNNNTNSKWKNYYLINEFQFFHDFYQFQRSNEESFYLFSSRKFLFDAVECEIFLKHDVNSVFIDISVHIFNCNLKNFEKIRVNLTLLKFDNNNNNIINNKNNNKNNNNNYSKSITKTLTANFNKNNINNNYECVFTNFLRFNDFISQGYVVDLKTLQNNTFHNVYKDNFNHYNNNKINNSNTNNINIHIFDESSIHLNDISISNNDNNSSNNTTTFKACLLAKICFKKQS
jgi:hypothetical protein